MFAIQPLFDRVIVREIPIEDYFSDKEKELLPLDDARMKLRTRRGVVVAVGRDVKEVLVDLTVLFEDTAMYDPIYLRAYDEVMPPEVKYWQIREGDLKGVLLDKPSIVGTDLKPHRELPNFMGIAGSR